MNENIWYWSKDSYRVHVKTKELYEELMSWARSEHGSFYYEFRTGKKAGYDVTIMDRYLERAEELLSETSKYSEKAV